LEVSKTIKKYGAKHRKLVPKREEVSDVTRKIEKKESFVFRIENQKY
jgi:hypothetical protein